MKGDRYLNQSLPDFFLSGWRSPPNVFQNFMSIEELALIEQCYPVQKIGLVCRQSHCPRRKENLAPRREVSKITPALASEDPIVGTGSHEE